jgi:hypothetical protein
MQIHKWWRSRAGFQPGSGSRRNPRPASPWLKRVRVGRTTRLCGQPVYSASLVLILAASVSFAATNDPAPEPAVLKAPRDFYNIGTRDLRAGKLSEAELSLQTAVASQDGKVQVAALYNLGHVRFQQGAEALKKAPDAGQAEARGRAACAATDQALQVADAALNSYDLEALVAAYVHGRGVRKQIKSATEAVKKALEEHGAVLARWQRASGDFKSAFELHPDDDARANAERVDRQIAKLVDRQQALKLAMQSCNTKKESLQGKLGEMKKRIPKDKLKQCQNGEEDDDEEEPPKEPKPGQQEPKPKESDGRERLMSPEEAARLLEALKLDANRKLPMGFEKEAKPRDRTGRDW